MGEVHVWIKHTHHANVLEISGRAPFLILLVLT